MHDYNQVGGTHKVLDRHPLEMEHICIKNPTEL